LRSLSEPTTAHAEDKTITVFAAASLKNALDDVDAAFTKQSGIKVVVSYGASSTLAKQIEQSPRATQLRRSEHIFGHGHFWLNCCPRAEPPLGIVYETDAKVEPAVKVIGVFPDNTHDPIIYPVALTADAKPDALQYLSFLRSQTAKSVFEHYGFSFLVKPTS
jgi:ABC-type molybdate transport system substrate-binding protein